MTWWNNPFMAYGLACVGAMWCLWNVICGRYWWALTLCATFELFFYSMHEVTGR